ncbi:16S rRNA (uracil(1498)-N(3))-methyltransferase [Taylorella equigenitalis]|uniref:Ribosomal RNA small subunit methyltransferase E n=1 Tax=Taylorella equigenitalis (strain MCE9) TaxID=937774 RepID=A0A654KFX0_TAYEM|nr:16S rRNA (uracil(1498)-N(3))-methyltransferase [Taylorella equigenitalis]ADU91300.1 Ribosomal RNA small subunit methyltransferase E [Taylorella equigenitalis MCE9]WDU56117.1 16S rRNA (uracil(1498)-N(3))-methyltransferase [Taylorella equigenitalis]
MLTPRFFYTLPLEIGSTIKLPKDITNHAGRSLRLKEGTKISLFSGDNTEYHGTISFNSSDAFFNVEDIKEISRELPLRIGLAQGLATGDKMDFIIEKAVEIGVSDFYPIIAKRSVLKLNNEKFEKKLAHWSRIIISASEQCGRNKIMQLHQPQDINEFIQNTSDSLYLIAHPDAQSNFLGTAETEDFDNSIVLIGPEGGWDSTELEKLRKENSRLISLGQRVLRTETAGIVTVSYLTAIIQNRP